MFMFGLWRRRSHRKWCRRVVFGILMQHRGSGVQILVVNPNKA
jgi:hypothetical protein